MSKVDMNMAFADFALTPAKVAVCFSLPILFLSYTCISSYLRRARNSACREPPRYPQKRLLLGLDILQEVVAAVNSKRYLRKIQLDYTLYGNTFTKSFLLSSTVCTVEPENLNCILASRFRDYGITSVRKEALRPFLGNNILTADGAEWTHARAKLRPSFSKKQTGDLKMLEVHVDRLIRAIRTAGEREAIDLKDLFLRLTADVATESFYGESVDSLRSGSLSSVMEAFQVANRGCEDRARKGRLSVFFRQSDFKRSVQVMRQYVQRYVSDERNEKKEAPLEEAAKEKYVLLRELRKVIDDPDRLRDELLTILFAGRDTTGSLLCSLFFTLARRTDIWSRVRSEVDALKGNRPRDDDLQHMRYTKFCLNETLRLYPPLPHNARVALRDTTLPLGGGPDGKDPIFIRQGTKVEFHASALHRRKDLWGEDADEFRPERWEGNIDAWTFLAFSGGPRQCIGQQFGFTVALYTVVRLAQAFSKIESQDTQPWTEDIGVVCFPANGVKVKMSSDL